MNSFAIADKVTTETIRPLVMDGEFAIGVFIGQPATLIYSFKNDMGRLSEEDLVSIGNSNWAYTGQISERAAKMLAVLRDTFGQLIVEGIRQYQDGLADDMVEAKEQIDVALAGMVTDDKR